MQWLAISQRWSAYIPAILDQWPEADEADLTGLDGSRSALAAYLAERTGRDITAVTNEIEDWRAGATPADIRMDESEDMRNITASGRYIQEGEDPSDDDQLYGDEGIANNPVGRAG